MLSYNFCLVSRDSFCCCCSATAKMSLPTTAESSSSCTSEAPELSTSTSSGSVLSADSDAASVLVNLRAPRLSELTRKWKIDCNPPKGCRRSRGRGPGDPKSVSPGQRAKEFADDHGF